jgi:hypothetical protein
VIAKFLAGLAHREPRDSEGQRGLPIADEDYFVERVKLSLAAQKLDEI